MMHCWCCGGDNDVLRHLDLCFDCRKMLGGRMKDDKRVVWMIEYDVAWFPREACVGYENKTVVLCSFTNPCALKFKIFEAAVTFLEQEVKKLRPDDIHLFTIKEHYFG